MPYTAHPISISALYSAPHQYQCPLGSVASYLVYADEWLHIPMTHTYTAGVKAEIREAVELEEKINYERRMAKQWVSEVEGMVGDLPTAYVTFITYSGTLG